MAKLTYGELLRDPRWQRVRLEKLSSARWNCQLCCDSSSTLHVHHKRYVKGRMPWEYDEAELVVLCAECHELEHGAKDQRADLLARLDVDGPRSADDFFAYGIGALLHYDSDLDPTVLAIAEKVQQTNPLPVAAGKLGAALVGMYSGPFCMRSQELNRFAELLATDVSFSSDLMEFLQKHGVAAIPAEV